MTVIEQVGSIHKCQMPILLCSLCVISKAHGLEEYFIKSSMVYGLCALSGTVCSQPSYGLKLEPKVVAQE